MLRQQKRTAVLILVCLMLVFVTACSGSNRTNNSAEPNTNNAGSTASSDPTSTSSAEAGPVDWSKRKELTLNVFSTLANFSGEQPGWFAKLAKDKFNIKLNVIQGGIEGKLATQMASGNLGDLIVGMGGKNYTDAIKAGLLLDWTKDGLLDKYGQNMKKYAPYCF